MGREKATWVLKKKRKETRGQIGKGKNGRETGSTVKEGGEDDVTSTWRRVSHIRKGSLHNNKKKKEIKANGKRWEAGKHRQNSRNEVAMQAVYRVHRLAGTRGDRRGKDKRGQGTSHPLEEKKKVFQSTGPPKQGKEVRRKPGGGERRGLLKLRGEKNAVFAKRVPYSWAVF